MGTVTMRGGPATLALVGLGRMGAQHLAASARCRHARIVAACDPGLSDAPLPLRSWADLLADVTIEGMVIAAPTHLHLALAGEALSRGKHVLCEKPVGFDAGAVLRLGALAASRRLVFQIGLWRRFAAPFRQMRDVLGSGAIGALQAVRMAQWDASPPPPAFCDPRVSGGIEIDCGVHEFDLAYWLCGREIRTVAAVSPPAGAALAEVGDLDTVVGLAALDGDAAMTIDLTRRAGFRDSIRTEAIGLGGSVALEFDTRGTFVLRRDGERRSRRIAADPIAAALVRQLDGFARGLRGGARVADAAGAEDMARALRCAMALRDARRTRRWTAVPRC